jgi:hypothetical protein
MTDDYLPLGWSREKHESWLRELQDNIRYLGRFGPSPNEYDADRLDLTEDDRRLLEALHISAR